MVHEVCAPDALDERVAAMTKNLLAGGPRAQAAAKALLRTIAHRAIDDHVIEETAQAIAKLRATAEAKEGVTAFLDKREPEWRTP
jgi:methylglutaconyl-CoA hydratase